jgi:hypothetical protein
MASEEPTRAIRIVEDQWANFRHIIEAVAIVAAGAWAFYTFIYQEDIKPANEPAALDVTIALRRLGHDDRRELLGIALHFHNSGKTEINIAADAYNVWGERFASRQSKFRLDRPTSHDYTFGLPRVSRRVVRTFAELRDMAVGGRAGSNIVLEPDANETIDDVIVVPRGEYDLLHGQVIAVPVKTSQTQKVRVAMVPNKTGGYWLNPIGNDVFEDDNDTDFALVP